MPKRVRVQDVTNARDNTATPGPFAVEAVIGVQPPPAVTVEAPAFVQAAAVVQPAVPVGAFQECASLCRALAVCSGEGEYQRLKGWAETLVKAL